MTLELELSFQYPEFKILEANILNSRFWKFKTLEGLNPESRNTKSILNMHKN